MSDVGSVKVTDLLPVELTAMIRALREELQKQGAEEFPKFAWGVISKEANGSVHEALDCDVLSLVAKGWCVARELHEYKDRQKHPKGERSVVTLAEHSLISTAYPEVVVTVAGKSFKPLKLTLVLTATFKTAALTIEDGYIKVISGGNCSVTAQLKYGEVDLHKPLGPREIPLPGRYSFKAPGLLIE